MRKITEREIAVNVLSEILDLKAYNNIALRKALDNHNIPADIKKNFITELVNGVVRNLIFIDYIIDLYSKTPVLKMKRILLNIIRTGVYQLIFMDRVPDSAAVDEAVKLARVKGFNNLCGFVNGVLRSVAKNKENIFMPDSRLEPIKYLALKYSYPSSMLERWMKEMTELELNAMLEANSKPPNVTACVNTLKTSPDSLVEILKTDGITAERGKLHKNALYLTNMSNITESECFRNGYFHIMSESSMLAVDALAPEPGQVVLDVCAAPGGKSFYAAEIMRNEGRVISRDIHEHKIKLINDGASRLGINTIRPEIADATVFDARTEGIADRLLIDAPCSGLGLVRKKPDIKYAKNDDDILKLSQLQRDILSACHRYLKIGGVMVYSTCTLTHEENTDNILWFSQNFGYRIDPLNLDLPVSGITDSIGCIRLIPNEIVADGFFIARLIRER